MAPAPGIHDPALVEELRVGDGDDELSVIVRLYDPDALPRGVRIVTRFGDIATVRVARDRLQELSESASVTALEASRNLRPSDEADEGNAWDEAGRVEEPPETSTYTRRPDGLETTGRGCIVAALDWGIDFCHPAFRRPDGSTRILSLWDQRSQEPSGPDNRWGYGRILTSADIDRALATAEPYLALDYHPADAGGKAGAHGTHVLDIAAGGGRASGMPGVAPEADLMFVHLARTTDILGEGNLGDSASVLEALDHVFSLAGDRPCVVNMSVGAHGGPHDGSTLVELGIDQAVALAPGRAVVNSAGNYRNKRAHTMGRIRADEVRVVRFRVPAHDTNDSEVELFYQHVDRFTVEVLGPTGERVARAGPGQDVPVVARGMVLGHLHHKVRHGTTGDHHVDLLLRPDAPGGVWSLRLTGDVVNDGRYHAWIERDKGFQPTFVTGDVVTSSTTGTLCNGRLSITCGCADPHRDPIVLAPFSSSGPTRDGRIKPELAAPGSHIRAARSTPQGESPGDRYTLKSGTSMAAPHVAGAIALMFEAAGQRLEIYDTRALLFGSVDPSPFFGRPELEPDLHRFGYGMLDLVAVEQAAREFGIESRARVRVEQPKEATVEAHVEAEVELPVPVGAGALNAEPEPWASLPRFELPAGPPAGPPARRPRERIRYRPEPLTETTVCAPADVPDPERRRLHPKLFRNGPPQNSHNPSVGHAQELLNLFLGKLAAGVPCVDTSPPTQTFLTSSRAQLAAKGQDPLVVDCEFGRSTEIATKMFQACVKITRDGVIGATTWALLEGLAVRPAPAFTPRPCCILAPGNTFAPHNILSPGNIGVHGAASELSGLLYCGKGGFFDLGHARDMMDLTKFLHEQLTLGPPPQIIRTVLGIVSIRRAVADPLETAAAIAFQDALGHEITSWDVLAPGGRNSSFSPEDLPSNFLGTLVARRAIARMTASGATFSAAATAELSAMLTSLDVQSKVESEAAFNLINHKWVDFVGAFSLAGNNYLLRRNFTRAPFQAGHPSDAPPPVFVTAPFSATALADFDYFHLEGGNVLAGPDFPAATTRVRREAKAAFGADFDKP